MPYTKKTWLRFLPWTFLLGGFALYGLGAARGLSISDSGEFLGVAATLGVAHPTGYPLYAVLGQLATFFPWGDGAFLINLVSAAAAAGAAFFVALAAAELAGQFGWGDMSKALAIATAGLLALAGRTLWSVATMAEVYALNALFWGALLWAALRLRRTGAARELYVLALVAGLSLANHMTIALLFPALFFIGWPGREKAKTLARAVPLTAAFFLGGVSVNLYTALRAAQQPLFNWNDPSTAGSLYVHLAGMQYRGLLFSGKAAGVKAALGKYWELGKYDFVTAPFAAAGLAWLFAKRRWAVASALVLYYVGYFAYCAVYSIPDIGYYFIPLHLAAIFFTAVGLGVVTDVIGRRRPTLRAAAAAVVLALILVAGVWAFASNYPYGNRRDFTFAETYGRRLLASLPAGALVFSSGDTNGNLNWYNVYVRRFRPDVAVADQVGLANRGYVTSLARRHPDLILPEEEEIGFLAAEAFARGVSDRVNVTIRKSDDFILPQLLEPIITYNASRRRIFWGLGDPGAKLQGHLIPYDVVMEVVLKEPPRAELARRAGDAVAALTGVTALVQKNGPAELRDESFREHANLYYGSLSDFLSCRGIYETQLELLESYVGLFPADADAYENLARVYAVVGRHEKAAENYRRALALAPEKVDLRAPLVKSLSVAGRADEAAAVAAEAGAGEEGEADYLRGIAYREEGKVERALAAFEAAAPYFDDDADFWLEWGLTHDAAGDYNASARAFSRALELEPGRSWLYTARGVEEFKLGDLDAAAADFEAAVKLNAGDAQARYNLACIYAKGGRTAAALEELEAAVKMDPQHYVAIARDDEDLASCRGVPAFERLMAEYGEGTPAP
jgi:tetratricopeptide (TPR) repeat protein